MNILDRIEARLRENKGAVKLYKTATSAEKVAEKEVKNLNDRHADREDCRCDYIITYVPSQAKYTIIFHFTPWIRAAGGTYVGWFANRNFFSI